MPVREPLLLLFTGALTAVCGFGCPASAGNDDDSAASSTAGDDDGAAEPAGDDDTAPDGPVDTIDEYMDGYCGDFAAGCGLYADHAACRENLWTEWYSRCEVVDAAALDRCATWIAGLTCEETGWLDDCDLAVECDL